MIRKTIHLALFALLILILASGALPASASGEKARNGVLDLRGYNLFGGGIFPLDGAWEFYWNRLVTPVDIAGKTVRPGGFYEVPLYWTDYPGLSLPSRRYATYRLRVLKDERKGHLALMIPEIYSEFALWINGVLIDAHGSLGKIPQRYIRPEVYDAYVEGPVIEILLQIKNYSHGNAGIGQSFYLGSPGAVYKKNRSATVLEIILVAVCIFAGLYHTILFSFRTREKALLYFGLFCIIIALRTLSTGTAFLMQMLPDLSFGIGSRIATTVIPLSVISFMLFVHHFFEEGMGRWTLRVLLVLHWLYFLMVITFPTFYYATAFSYYLLIVVASCVPVMYTAVRSLRRGDRYALIFLSGFIFIFAGVINDTLHYKQIINTGHFLSLFFSGFIIAQSVMLAIKFSNEHRKVEELSGRLQLLDKLKDDFLANTSHELRTPLNGIIGIAESLIDGVTGKLPDKTVENLRLIAFSGKRLSSLVNDILDFSRIKNDQITLRKKPTDLRAITDLVLLTSRHLAGSKPLTLNNDISTDLPPVTADENRLQQVLYNLVGNAVKFTDSGEIRVGARRLGDEVIEVTVADTGIGVPEEARETIFESFRQADGSISRIYGGTGLGLAITRQIVELHGGTISLDSRPGEGSTFRFTLPIAGNAAETGTIQPAGEGLLARIVPDALYGDCETIKEEPVKETPAGKAEEASLILVVDDDEINLAVLSNHLKLYGYAVAAAAGGYEALKIVEERSHEIDLVLLDVMMPRISGYEVCQIIRQMYSSTDLPVIMLTAKNLVVDLIRGLDSGANDYLVKPFDRRELIARARTHISLRKAAQDARKLVGIERELRIAREIQYSILPQSLPEVPGLRCAARYIPMESVGGDFYDLHVTESGGLAVLMTDVSGHGIPAALIASMIKIVFDVMKSGYYRHDAIFKEINRILMPNLKSHFLTASYLFFEREEGRIYHSSAGHVPLLLYRPGEGIREFSPLGTIIGVAEDVVWRMERIEVREGDRIILYTDGISESLSSDYVRGSMEVEPAMFGSRRMGEVITEGADRPAEAFADFLLEELRRWTGADAFEDDITLLVFDVIAMGAVS